MPAYLVRRFNHAGITWHNPNVKGVIGTPLGMAETCFTLLFNEQIQGQGK